MMNVVIFEFDYFQVQQEKIKRINQFLIPQELFGAKILIP
jgi:hypothetical protein